MTLHNARTLFTRERMDWNRPHLNWMPRKLYRLAREAMGRR
ncbi:hypothetical protein ROA7023_02174 [Roseisalinus antarcticus]|uniref:Uncharacterized protein n=1 Tax=Roseisalinus antarcticus TaxID=254357 RepID=A0A1Y5T224_9RHOB|nr:hypothetical protein ROA7023_02174 [Roseisalinus antarcticus]